MVTILIVIFSILTNFYSLPLGLLCIAYFSLTSLLIRQLWIDITVLCIVILVGVFNFHLDVLIRQPVWLVKYYSVHGLFPLIIYQLLNWQQYLGGLCLILVIPLLLRISYSLHLRKELKQSLPLYAVDNQDGTVLNRNVVPPVVILDQELNQHCLVVGTTGSGKTTTMLVFVKSMVKRGMPVIYVDGKGANDLVDRLRTIANEANRVFKVFTLRPNPQLNNLAGYNPFSSGTATEWKNRIMALFTQAQSRGQEHFSLGEQNYINFVANILYKRGKAFDLRVVLGLLEQPDKLLALAQSIDPVIAMKLAKLHNDRDISQLVGDVVKLLELFVYSDYGYLFNTAKFSDVIKIRESILNKEVILFLFDASSYPEDTRKVARMVINDINSSFAGFDKFTKCLCVFDEFASYASENLADTISLQRSNGMHALVGTQSIATVKLKGESTKRVAEELIACCNTYIIHRINHAHDAENLVSVIGTKKSYEVVTQFDNQVNDSNRFKTVKQIDEYKIHPQVLKELKTGEAIIYRKASIVNSVPKRITIVG